MYLVTFHHCYCVIFSIRDESNLFFSRPPTAIDVMVDPDGTLDALADLDLTSPLTADRGPGPGAPQQGPSAAGLPPRDEGTAGQEMAERDPGLHLRHGDAAPL